jgi:hypothetical protein
MQQVFIPFHTSLHVCHVVTGWGGGFRNGRKKEKRIMGLEWPQTMAQVTPSFLGTG